jgi:DNA topoisomerase-1
VASNELHFSPKETMKLCQTLYEAGYITYMRTDSKKYSKEFIEKTK